MSNNINQKIGSATKWSSITEIVAKLITPATNMILARLLVPESFGIVATITMVISFAEVFTDAGFQKYIIQHEFPDDETLDRSTNVAFWTNLGVSFIICGLIFLFRHSIAELVGNSGLGNSISIASVLIIIAAFSSIQIARYRRALDFKTLFFVRIITSLMPLVVTVPLAVVLRNYWALLIGTFASQLCNAIILTVRSKWKPKFYYNIELFKEMFAFTAWTLLESISIWLTLNIGTFIVGNRLSGHYLGIYKTSMSTVNSYMSVITAALTPVLFSALSRYQNDEDNFRKTYYKFQRLTAIFVIPMGIGAFVYQDLVTRILLGSQWTEASGFIGVWGLTSAFSIVFANFSSEVYRSKGNPKVSLIMQLVHLAFLVPVLIISATYGFKVLYMARSLVRLQMIACALLIMRVMYGFKVNHVVRNVLPMIASGTVMGVAGYLLKMASTNVVWQVISVILCIMVYFVVLFGVSSNTRRDFLESNFGRKLREKIKNGELLKRFQETLNMHR